ncbi:hypothetical protein AB0I28_26910 [Phytomonospora sp. NPDC050363]|uniref:hypothetical protein n=1 Tax=Phytomonospora sp. NPDC050363 TaxID=3155642 RepID=UPI0033EBCB84
MDTGLLVMLIGFGAFGALLVFAFIWDRRATIRARANPRRYDSSGRLIPGAYYGNHQHIGGGHSGYGGGGDSCGGDSGGGGDAGSC